MRLMLLLGLGVLALGGCGKTDGVAAGVAQPWEFRDVTQPPTMPAFAKVYPLAHVTVLSQSRGGASIVYLTGASIDDVVAFHRGQAAGAGLTQEQTRDDSSGSDHVFTAPGVTRGSSLDVEAGRNGGGSTVFVRYGVAQTQP
jgi:hypothetical protein